MRNFIGHRLLVALGLLVLSGCATGQDTALESADGENGRTTTSSSAFLQRSVMDFSDRFVTDVWQELDAYMASEPEIAKQVFAQRLKVAIATSSMSIAASRDPRASLLDMAVFISVGRWMADQVWIPRELGGSADGLRDVYAQADREIREEVEAVLTPEQTADLYALIAAWKSSADPRQGLNVRLRNLDGVVLSDFQEAQTSKGLLASVQRLLGRVDQSLLYGGRMMFYVERTPLILSQQADLTVDRVAERFPIATVNPAFETWPQMARDLGTSFSNQLGSALDEREDIVREALPEIRASLASFEHITETLDSTMLSVNELTTTVEELPFEREDYASALESINASLTELDAIVVGLNELLAESEGETAPLLRLSQVLDQRTTFAVDLVFRRTAQLIGLVFAGAVILLIVARLLFPRRVVPEPKESGSD